MSVGPSEEDLISAVTESLEEKGRLSKLRAKIRSEVMAVLDSRKSEVDKNMPVVNDDAQVINELIREYLDWMEYKQTSSMLIAESGMNDLPTSRALLMRQLNVTDKGNSSQVPTLISLVSTFKNMNT